MSARPSAVRLPPLPDWSGVAAREWSIEAARRVRSTWPSVEAARSSGQALALRVALWRAGVPFVHREQCVELVRSAAAPAAATLRVVTWRMLNEVAPLSGEARATVEASGAWDTCRVPRPPAPEGLQVLVMSGLPGAGKDTWLARECPARPVVSLDALRAELSIGHGEEPQRIRQAAFARARALIAEGRPFAWNSTLLRARERRGLFDWLVHAGCHVTFVSLEVSARLQQVRNSTRERVVPHLALERMLARWEPVLPGESHAERFFEDSCPVSFET
ncbi:MAG: AAA family ATPase [Myxococcaceae bacterium]|nr:AAA family ATPase [Myxococcaceae bacterium]